MKYLVRNTDNIIVADRVVSISTKNYTKENGQVVATYNNSTAYTIDIDEIDNFIPMVYKYENEEVSIFDTETYNSVVSGQLEDVKARKIEEIKIACTANNPVTLEVDFINGAIKTITFNGGDSSASAIAGAVTLSQNLGETSVNLWDYENKVHTGISFDEAMQISAIIAKKWRDDMLKRQNLLTQINNPDITIEELGSIKWQD